MKDTLLNIVEFGKTIHNEVWSVQDATSKLFEEGGELSEQAMIRAGRLPHKTPNEDGDFEETADVIICALDVLLRVNRNMTSEEIVEKLNYWLTKKSGKWKGVQERLK